MFLSHIHVRAYEDAGVLGLPLLDKIKILLTPDAEDLFSDRGLKQVLQIADDQAIYFIAHPFYTLGQIGQYIWNSAEIGRLVEEFYQKNKTFFDSQRQQGPYPIPKDPRHMIYQLIQGFIPTKIII